MDEVLLVPGTGHSETTDPVGASNCLIALSDTTKRWLLDQSGAGRQPCKTRSYLRDTHRVRVLQSACKTEGTEAER